VTPEFPEVEDPELSFKNQVTANEILKRAMEKEARALVMTNYATKGFFQEVMFGTLAMLASRNAPLPLILIPAAYAFE
jgi:nucleotide-binding universal stress UspA family protein